MLAARPSRRAAAPPAAAPPCCCFTAVAAAAAAAKAWRCEVKVPSRRREQLGAAVAGRGGPSEACVWGCQHWWLVVVQSCDLVAFQPQLSPIHRHASHTLVTRLMQGPCCFCAATGQLLRPHLLPTVNVLPLSTVHQGQVHGGSRPARRDTRGTPPAVAVPNSQAVLF
jgi:hypothetical protein